MNKYTFIITEADTHQATHQPQEDGKDMTPCEKTQYTGSTWMPT